MASRTVVSLYRPLLEPMGLTHPQYLVMLALWEDEPLRVSELADRLSLEPATLSPLLKRLEGLGFIERRRLTTDERRVEIHLTEAGSTLRSKAEDIPAKLAGATGLSTDELTELRDVLTRLGESLQASNAHSDGKKKS